MSRPRILAFVVVLVVGAVGAVKGGPILWDLLQYYRHARLAAPRAQGAAADWAREFGDPETMLASYVRAEDNETATRLKARAKPLGIDLEPGSPAGMEASSFGAYVKAESATRAGLPPNAPSGDVLAYLETHRTELRAIVDDLERGDPPAWKCDMSSIVPQEGVGLVGLRALNIVLAADAFYEGSAGRTVDADRTMRAAWQLLRSVHHRPLLIEELIAMALTTTDTAVIRRLDVDSGQWRPRLSDYDYPAGIARAIEAEAARHIRAHAADSTTSRAFRADYLDGMSANLRHMRTVSLTDTLDAAPDSGKLPMDAPGKVVAIIAAPGFDRAWLTARGVMLDLELTDRVLEVRQVRAHTGRWPAVMPDVVSRYVSGARWVYVSADDVISISLSRNVPSYSQALRFEARR